MPSSLRYAVLCAAGLAVACGEEASDPAAPRAPDLGPAAPEFTTVTTPALLLTAHALYYCYTPGGNRMCVILKRELRITSSAGPLEWTAAKSQPWIVLSPAGGTTPTTVTISVDPRKLPTWRPAFGAVTISAAAWNSPQKVSVQVNQVGRTAILPALAFSDSALGFCFFPAASRGCVRLEEHVLFTSTGGQLAWKAVSSNAWIVVQPTSGTTDTDVRVLVDRSRLPAGCCAFGTSISGSLTVSAAGARNSPQKIPVKLQFYSWPLPQ